MKKTPSLAANNIRILRKVNGMSQGQLGKKLNVSKSYICHLEKGSRALKPETLAMIAKVLEVAEQDLANKSLTITVKKIKSIKAYAAFKKGEIICHGPASYAILGSKANAETFFDEADEIKEVEIKYVA